MGNIETRRTITYNNDPQRRCYNGCHYSTATKLSAWEVIEYDVPEVKLETRLTFWRELNEYAVSQRGEGALCEFRSVTII